MFQQRIEKRRVGSIVLVSICVHGAALFLVILNSIWNTDLHAAAIKPPTPILYESLQPHMDQIHVVMHHDREATSSQKKKGGGGTPQQTEPPSPVAETPVTQNNIVPAANPMQEDPSSDLDPPCNPCDESEIGPGDKNSGIGSDPGPGTGGGDPDTIYNPGLDVQAPILIRKVEPVYPEQARRLRIQGFVVMQAIIGLTGEVEDIRVISSAHPWLSESALKALERWQYRPGQIRNTPVRCYLTVTVNFSLH